MSDTPSPADTSGEPALGPRSVFSRPPAQGPGASASEAAWSEVTPLADGRYRMRLGGFYGPAWMAQLCCTLAQQKLSIERAHALRARNQSWMSELTVCALEGAGDPHAVAYAPLVDAFEPARALELDGFTLEATSDHGGSLLLTIDAHDTLGLLGTLLQRVAELELYPIEMHIDTQRGLVHDRMWLGGKGGSVPAREVEDALRAILTRAVAG